MCLVAIVYCPGVKANAIWLSIIKVTLLYVDVLWLQEPGRLIYINRISNVWPTGIYLMMDASLPDQSSMSRFWLTHQTVLLSKAHKYENSTLFRVYKYHAKFGGSRFSDVNHM